MRRGRPPIDRSRLNLAIELIRDGASTAEAASAVGVHRNLLSAYGISKRAIDRSREIFNVDALPDAPRTTAEAVLQREVEIRESFRRAIGYAHIPLIATAAAAQLESDRLQVCVRADRLKKAAKRLAEVQASYRTKV